VTFTVWKLGELVARFETREAAMSYTRGNIWDYCYYIIVDEEDERRNDECV
jgi:hypothetical protein